MTRNLYRQSSLPANCYRVTKQREYLPKVIREGRD